MKYYLEKIMKHQDLSFEEMKKKQLPIAFQNKLQIVKLQHC